MDKAKRLPVGLLLLSIGILLGIISSALELSHTWDSFLSFVAGAMVGAGLPLIISGWNARRKS